MGAHHHHDHDGHDHAGDGHAGDGHAGDDHGHHHHQAPAGFDRAFAIGIALNLAFVIVEGAFGLLAQSVALLADAGHNLSDVLGLAIAWGGAVLARRAASGRFTWGFGGSTILAALANALLLMVALGAIVLEASQRIGSPPPVHAETVSIVAAVGIAVNALTAWLFARGRKGDINIRGAFLHMASDAVVSLGVVIAGIIILFTGLDWIDPVVSLVIAAIIFWQTWGLLRESVEMSLNAVPRAIDPYKVEAALAALPGVRRVHDLHIWPMSTTETAMTAHLVIPAGHPGDRFLAEVQTMLTTRFRIGHATLQVETGDAGCAPGHSH